MDSPILKSDINTMLQSILLSGVGYTNRYEIQFGLPTLLRGRGVGIDLNTSLRCTSITVPSKSLNTVNYRLYGPARNMPTEITYTGELNATFLLSADLRERRLFETWIDGIANPFDYKLSYYDDYITNLEITTLAKDDSMTHLCVVEEAYPKSIGDIQLGYDKDGELMQQEVTFCFRKFVSLYSNYSPAASNPNLTPQVQNKIPNPFKYKIPGL